MRFSSVMFLSGACAWVTPSTLATLSSWRRFLLATLSLGDAFSWRRLLLATPSLGDAFFLGDAFSWRRLLLATPSFLVTPIAASNGEKIKTKNQGKVFLKLVFFLYLGDLIKKPRKGKKSIPFNKTVTSLLT